MPSIGPPGAPDPGLARVPHANLVREQIFLPARHGGLSIPDPVDLLHAAYMASVAAAMPHLVTVAPVAGIYVPPPPLPALPAPYPDSAPDRLAPTTLTTHIFNAPLNAARPSTHDHIAECISKFRDSGLSDIVNQRGKEAIATTVPDFVSLYRDGVPQHKLQRLIMRQFNSIKWSTFINQPGLSDETTIRLRSVADEHAGLWLTALPTHPKRQLDDMSFRLGVCLRLDIHPFALRPDHPRLRCSNWRRGIGPCERADLRFDFAHRVSCFFQNKVGRYRMHNHVLAELLLLAERLGHGADNSPKGYQGVRADGSKDQKQPDGLIVVGGQEMLIDVRGVCPTAHTHLAINAVDHQAACNLAADNKEKKYQKIAAANNAIFQPFVFTTYGGLHKSAVELIEHLTKFAQGRARARSESLKLDHLTQLSMGIMRDNAKMILEAFREAPTG